MRSRRCAPIAPGAICGALIGICTFVSTGTVAAGLGAALVGALVGIVFSLVFSGFDPNDPSPVLRHRSKPPRSMR